MVAGVVAWRCVVASLWWLCLHGGWWLWLWCDDWRGNHRFVSFGGRYMVTRGDHVNGGCCFDYGKRPTHTSVPTPRRPPGLGCAGPRPLACRGLALVLGGGAAGRGGAALRHGCSPACRCLDASRGDVCRAGAGWLLVPPDVLQATRRQTTMTTARGRWKPSTSAPAAAGATGRARARG